ncbi:MAG: hypothetical protein IPL59_13755 [Candidatus Competibacteraceae bacterium]|nr:hypothetical protein [Candidatus Competibacteraceae bacterium]
MNRIDLLLENYRSHIKMPLRLGLPASQRVWFAVYPAEEERRLIHRLDDFAVLTQAAGHPWIRIDLQGRLAQWLATVDEEERAEWFKNPDDVDLYAKTEWKAALTTFFQTEATRAAAPESTVFALTGLMDLYDFLHVSDLIESLVQTFVGYLLVFFPGEREGNTYRFLNARTGWNYLAAPILCEK